MIGLVMESNSILNALEESQALVKPEDNTDGDAISVILISVVHAKIDLYKQKKVLFTLMYLPFSKFLTMAGSATQLRLEEYV